MKTGWTKGNNMLQGEKEQTDLKFSFWFSVLVLMSLFAVFVSTAAYLVWNPFSELTPNWRPKPSADFALPYLVFKWLSLPRHVQLPTNTFSPFILRPPLYQCFRLSSFRQSESVADFILNPGVPNYFSFMKRERITNRRVRNCKNE